MISFVGALPLGVLNSTAFQIAALQSVHAALQFAVVVVLVELIVVRLTLAYSNRINFNTKLYKYVLLITVVLLLYFAFSSFFSQSTDDKMITGTSLFPMIKSTIIIGLLLSALNPIQVPFWMGWNSVLLECKILNKKPSMYLSYILGIGVGSMAVLILFISAGTYIFQNYGQYNSIIKFTMGCFYLGFSLYLMFLLYKNHLKLNTQSRC